MTRYNYPRPHRRAAPPTEKRLYHALIQERDYNAHLQHNRVFLLNALEYMGKFVTILTNKEGK